MTNIKNTSIKIIIFTMIISIFINFALAPDVLASKKKKKLSDQEITQISDTINDLMIKVKSAALFSPKDNEDLINAKLKLDDSLESNPGNQAFSQLYFKAGIVYREREYRDDAIECFQTILDSFPDSSYALKAMNELKKMGVKIMAPGSQSGSSGPVPGN